MDLLQWFQEKYLFDFIALFSCLSFISAVGFTCHGAVTAVCFVNLGQAQLKSFFPQMVFPKNEKLKNQEEKRIQIYKYSLMEV